MQISKLDARTHLSIEMALAGEQGSLALIRQQDDAAARLGMCGAEIDAARAGRSFDLRGTRALELALALQHGNQGDARSRAIQAGIDADACCEIERIVAAHSSAAKVTDHD